MPNTPPTRTVEARSTRGASHPQWVNDTFEAFVLALDRRGLPVDLAMPIARWITVLHWLETGGDHEWNFNGGNVACEGTPDARGRLGWHGDCTQIRSGRYRAYASRADAVSDYLDLMEGRTYRTSWRYLLEHPEDGAGWYARLQADGYSSRSQAKRRFADSAVTQFYTRPRRLEERSEHMAKMTKKARSAAARKAARTREANKAKRSASARKGARKKSGRKSSGGKRRRTAKQMAATKRMLAANRAARGGGGGRKRNVIRATLRRRSRSSGGGRSLEGRVTNLEQFRTAQQGFNRAVLPAVAHVYKTNGMGAPQISGPASRALLGSGRR